MSRRPKSLREAGKRLRELLRSGVPIEEATKVIEARLDAEDRARNQALVRRLEALEARAGLKPPPVTRPASLNEVRDRLRVLEERVRALEEGGRIPPPKAPG